MKKMWKLNNKAVSPVIATILMVAITVVLAAVLYVMVMGFGGTDESAPSASFGSVDVDGNKVVNITIASVNPTTDLSKLQVKLNATGNPVLLSGADGAWQSVGNNNDVWYNDLANNNKASSGDFITINGTATWGGLGPGIYTLYLIYEPTGDVISSKEFTVV